MPIDFNLGENIFAQHDSADNINTPPFYNENVDRVPTPASDIHVTLTDERAPIVVLFGPSTSGKTMTMICLAKYLYSEGYTLEIDYNFCTNAWEYKKNASNFNTMLSTAYALEGTDHNDFLLIKVLDKKQRTVCQLLEAAGEDYFPSLATQGLTKATMPFPQYMNRLFDAKNKKIYMFLTEPYWKTETDRNQYVERISFCRKQFGDKKSKYIIIYNKIDTTPYINGGNVFNEAAKRQCRDEYKGIFNIFKNPSPFTFTRYLCDFIPFTSGRYGLKDPVTGKTPYTSGPVVFPAKLWRSIIKSIRG